MNRHSERVVSGWPVFCGDCGLIMTKDILASQCPPWAERPIPNWLEDATKELERDVRRQSHIDESGV